VKLEILFFIFYFNVGLSINGIRVLYIFYCRCLVFEKSTSKTTKEILNGLDMLICLRKLLS
jgi:hypothetical protein